VLRGEARIGKSALLDYAAAHAEGCEVVRATGVESEMELPFATLHQPCLPLLERVDRLPAPQAAALRTAFGLSSEVGVKDGRKVDAMKTSHASNLSSGGCRWVGTDLGEGGALVVLRAGGETVMQDADHAIEQVALGGDVAVTGRLASVVVGAGAG
jgi:hypothetical protein